MSSITSLQQRIAQLEQQKQIKEKDVTKLREREVLELALDDKDKARGEQQLIERDKQDMQQYDKELQDCQRQLTDLEHQVTNLENDITQRHNRHKDDLTRLEQQLKTDLQQLERQKARLIG